VKSELAGTEVDLLTNVLGDRSAAELIVEQPGGWRDLSWVELRELGLNERVIRAMLALQELVRRSYPELPANKVLSVEDVALVYGPRLGGLRHETMLAIALDAQNHAITEIEIAKGGRHGLSITPADCFRPLLRVGASAMLVIHNHPSGDPQPSAEDIGFTRAIAAIGELVGIPLVDHVVIAANGGGYRSLLDLGHLTGERNHETNTTAARQRKR
jgi:DNA repair protein RadC